MQGHANPTPGTGWHAGVSVGAASAEVPATLAGHGERREKGTRGHGRAVLAKTRET